MRKIIVLFSLAFLLVSNFVLAEEVVDTTAPTGTIVINDGSLFTNNREVVLTLFATDDISEVTEMQIANHTSYHDWEPFATSKTWTLTDNDAEKTVRVKFKDQAGNETTPGIPATVTLDTVPPIITLLGEAIIDLNVGDTYEDTGVTASDNNNGDVTYSVIETGTYVDTSTVGNYTIIYDVKDLAGNSAIQVIRTINVLEKDQENTNATLVSLSIKTPATKLDYKVGEELDINGLEVEGTYSDGNKKTETITKDNIIDFDSSVVATGKTVTIKIGDLNTTYLINITASDTGGSGGSTDNDSDFTATKSITVPDHCSITDTNGNTHLFPQEDSPSKFLGICALAKIKEVGGIDSFDMINYSFGLFIDSINKVKDPSSAYWALYLNDVYESRGLTTLPLVVGDKVSLLYVDFNNVELGSRLDIHINGLEEQQQSTVTSGSGNSINNTNNKDFSIPNATYFLMSKQKDNGSFGEALYTDWALIAIASNDDKLESKESMVSYLKKTPFQSEIATDNERHAMTLMAFGINPYNGTETNYVKKITESFDGIQIGDKSLLNDDVFGLIVLQNAGYDENDEIIKKLIYHIISKQSSDGLWENVDMTGASIMALKKFDSIKEVSDVILKAKDSLVKKQESDGGFGNSFSTSWAVQALSLDDSYMNEVKNAITYLSLKQQNDGGLEGSDINTRIWATSYFIPAALGKSWLDIMQSFPKIVLVPTVNEKNIDKKIIKKTKIQKITKEPVIVKDSTVADIELAESNNLGASVGDIDSINISTKTIWQMIVGVFSYIRNGLYNLSPF